jgi:hypothetical protein
LNELQAYCGIVCQTCPIYLATGEGDGEKQRTMRIEIARQITKHNGARFDPESITDCDGCRTIGGRLFSGCQKCSIRGCAGVKGLVSCALCPEYACKGLEVIFSTDPQARTRLEEIRSRNHVTTPYNNR